jgi:hypothetical protein
VCIVHLDYSFLIRIPVNTLFKLVFDGVPITPVRLYYLLPY